ncbi:MAG: CCA tRNA nucleotidyltransferase [archaeon]
MKVVFREVISKIKPTDREIKSSFELFNEIALFIKEKSGFPAYLMGSVAKGTFLTGDKDLDIFVLFPVTFSRDQLEKTGLEIGKAAFLKFGCKDYVISYAEHPYTKGIIRGFEVEIVPAYLIKSTRQLLSAVDRTPFHTEYIRTKLKNHDEVRLFKKFLKGIGCYGSDLKTEGFSGYLCELLVIYYGSFENIISQAQNWKHQQVIDIEGMYTEAEHKKARNMFKDQPLIVIDPTDKNRNVAAVLSVEKLARFIVHARRFREKPDRKYFFPVKRKIDAKKIAESYHEKGFNIYAVVFEKPDVIEDVLYPQLRKLRSNLVNYLKRHDFVVADSWVFANDECGIGLNVINTTVPKYKIIEGPSVFNPPKHQESFISTHKKVWLRDERYATEVKRDFNVIDDSIRAFFVGPVDALLDRGVPMNFAKIIAADFKVLSGKKIIRIKAEEFWDGVLKENIK